jgi:hypothetical protein
MIIKGKYRDILIRNGNVLQDRGWQSNTIVPDYGRFLAALMKKDFFASVGLEYLALGSGSQDNEVFRNKMIDYFQSLNEDEPHTGPLEQNDDWVWAKGIEATNIKYLDTAGNIPQEKEITNRLEIEVKIAQGEPTDSTLNFQEFALLGIDKDEQGKFDTDRMFLVNYVSHGLITKDKDMELSRTIKLLFPISELQAAVP